MGPVIAFGQQPCGIFPRRYLVAKVRTARRLQAKLGGEIVFFYHDSDHDPRETQTTLRHLQNGKPRKLNFAFVNKLQRKYTPLYLKRVSPDCREKLALQLPAYVPAQAFEAFRAATADTVGEFCLEIYAALGLLDGLKVVRSSDPAVRREACAVADCFVDVRYEGEVVRARVAGNALRLHAGGDSFIDLPLVDYEPEQVSRACLVPRNSA